MPTVGRPPGFSSAVWNTIVSNAQTAHTHAAVTVSGRVLRRTGSVSSGASKPSSLGTRLSPTTATAARSSSTRTIGSPYATTGPGIGMPGTASWAVNVLATTAATTAHTANAPTTHRPPIRCPGGA
jgi:hypothetical protein